MHSRRPVAGNPRATATATYTNDAARMATARNAFPMSAARAIYRFLVRRRIPISLITFTLILTTEGLLGVGWHRVNLQTDILFGVAVASWRSGLAFAVGPRERFERIQHSQPRAPTASAGIRSTWAAF